MSGSNFIDYVKICCRSGAGGAGSMHFRREKSVPMGGPDGGDGGRGGHVILRGNSQHWTLLHLKYQRHLIAKPGNSGEGGRRSGAQGQDVVIDVPLGTIAKDAETGEQVLEITEDGQEVVLLSGGRGGLGNSHFKSSTQQAPRHAQPGESGQERWFVLELKVLADVGLVGFPNAGKSTLLSVISAAKPEIADYPFTTLVPNLGVVRYRDFRSFVVADIPGIIEGASQGKGLGHRFLRHIERNSVLLMLIPATSDDLRAEYDVLLGELREYNPELLHKQRLLAISKADLLDSEQEAALPGQVPEGLPYVLISAVTGRGIDELKDRLWALLHASAPSPQANEDATEHTIS
jgi:GTP-binding protein